MKAIIAAVLLVPALALAQVPAVMSFQGRLLKTDGSPETGSPSIRFAIYASGTGGESLWHEDQTVALSNGFYSVKLGATSTTGLPASLFDGSPRWLGVTVGLGTELAPRQYIATVPYAFKAARADSAGAADTAAKATSADAATSAGAVPWSGVSGKPSAYPPAGHTHAGTDVTSAVASASSVPWSGVSGAPAAFPPSGHTHAGSDITTAVATATSLAASGTACGAGQAALGVDAKGNAQGCWTITGLVLGGYTVTSYCGSSGCTYSCSGNWGVGSCASSQGGCGAGTARQTGATVLCVR